MNLLMMLYFLLLCMGICQSAKRTVVVPGTFYYDGVPSFERDPFNYIVAIGGEDSAELATEEGDVEHVRMTSSEGVEYSCAVPSRTTKDTIKGSLSPTQGSETVASKTPFEYLDSLASSCLYRIETWWSFEFCYKHRIRQFHEDEDQQKRLDYTLGAFDPSTVQDNEIREDVIRGQKRQYVRQLYTSGDVCDQTEQSRTTEVRFFCDQHSQWSASAITGIVEGPTCNYVLSVSSPLLCKHPAFKTEETTRVIVCDRITTEGKKVKKEEPKDLSEKNVEIEDDPYEIPDEDADNLYKAPNADEDDPYEVPDEDEDDLNKASNKDEDDPYEILGEDKEEKAKAKDEL